MKSGVKIILFSTNVVSILSRLHRPVEVPSQHLTVKHPTVSLADRLKLKDGTSNASIVTSSSITPATAGCGESLWRPNSSSVCPSSCPFLRPSDNKFCIFSCVTEAACSDNNLLLGYADKETHQCSACLVDGCKTCAGSATQCAMCHPGFSAIGSETCLSNMRYVWWGLYVALAVGALLVIIYVLCLYCRPVVNEHVLEKAETHRSYTKVRNSCAGHRMYPLRTNLMRAYISGTGMMLHFRWQCAMIAWAVLMLLVTGAPALEAAITGWPSSSSPTNVSPGNPRMLDACHIEEGRLGERLARVESRYLIITAVIYVMTFIAAIFLAVQQRNFFRNEERRMVTMDDYALLVSGLPEEKGDARLEDEYLAFFKEAFPGVNIVGVSVIWKLEDTNKEKVEKLIHKELHHLEFGDHKDSQGGSESASTSRTTETGERTQDTRSHCCSLEFVDSLFLGFNCASPCCGTREAEKELSPVELLKSLETTGYAYLVVQSDVERQKAMQQKHEISLCFRGKFNITVRHTKLTPQTTLWAGYTVGTIGFLWRMFKDCVYMTLSIGLWTALFYMPYAAYIMKYNTVRGMTQGGVMQSTLLGLLTVIGNQLIYLLCLIFAGRSGFRSKDMRDCFYCILYLIANLVNICLDMWTVYLLAQGQAVDIDPTVGEGMEHPSIREALYEQLFAYLWPSTMFLAFAFEPLFIGLIPYYLGVWLIRSRKDVRTHAAESCLECVPFDLSRYVDILIIIVLCILMTFLATIKLWYIYAALVFSLLFIYAWDQFRYLRLCKRTEFDQDTMDRIVHWLTAIPCAMLGVAVVLRAHGAAGYSIVNLDSVEKWNLAMVCGAVLVGHLVVHFALLHWLVPFVAKRTMHMTPRQKKPYEVAASVEPCNWFTANIVQCLRSRHIYQHLPACSPYVCGKEYLMRRNPELGLYYEEPKVIPEDDLLHELQKEIDGKAP